MENTGFLIFLTILYDNLFSIKYHYIKWHTGYHGILYHRKKIIKNGTTDQKTHILAQKLWNHIWIRIRIHGKVFSQ